MMNRIQREGTRRIAYAVTRPGTSVFKVDPADDPMSPSFIPPERRSAIDQARFWAVHSNGQTKRPAQGEFDG